MVKSRNVTKEQKFKPVKQPKPKKCKVCGNEYVPQRLGQIACSPKCAIVYVNSTDNKIKEKVNRELNRLARAERKKAKDSIKTRSEVMADIQKVVNKYVRLRDVNDPCISCGRYNPNVKRNAGHYIPVGRNSALRYDEKNIHSQCEHCNQYKSGNLTRYRIRLIKKIGIEEVERLESNRELKRWSIEELRQIEQEFKLKRSNLIKERGEQC